VNESEPEVNDNMNAKEMTMRKDERATLIQRWIIVTDAQGQEHLEARWVVEGESQALATHAA
jgi:hypothetical protein